MKINRRHFSTLDSTNQWAREHLEEFSQGEITLITASEQTSGRGRFKRTWVTPPGKNIYATFCFFLEPDVPKTNLAQIMGISAAKILTSLGFDPKLKWPNDILLNKKKVAGILCETVDQAIILGIGLNVNIGRETFEKIDQPATSLASEKEEELNLDEVLDLLQEQFLKDLTLYIDKGFSPFKEKFESLLNLERGQEYKGGTYLGVNPDGSLRLDVKGRIESVY